MKKSHRIISLFLSAVMLATSVMTTELLSVVSFADSATVEVSGGSGASSYTTGYGVPVTNNEAHNYAIRVFPIPNGLHDGKANGMSSSEYDDYMEDISECGWDAEISEFNNTGSTTTKSLDSYRLLSTSVWVLPTSFELKGTDWFYTSYRSGQFYGHSRSTIGETAILTSSEFGNDTFSSLFNNLDGADVIDLAHDSGGTSNIAATLKANVKSFKTANANNESVLFDDMKKYISGDATLTSLVDKGAVTLGFELYVLMQIPGSDKHAYVAVSALQDYAACVNLAKNYGNRGRQTGALSLSDRFTNGNTNGTIQFGAYYALPRLYAALLPAYNPDEKWYSKTGESAYQTKVTINSAIKYLGGGGWSYYSFCNNESSSPTLTVNKTIASTGASGTSYSDSNVEVKFSVSEPIYESSYTDPKKFANEVLKANEGTYATRYQTMFGVATGKYGAGSKSYVTTSRTATVTFDTKNTKPFFVILGESAILDANSTPDEWASRPLSVLYYKYTKSTGKWDYEIFDVSTNSTFSSANVGTCTKTSATALKLGNKVDITSTPVVANYPYFVLMDYDKAYATYGTAWNGTGAPTSEELVYNKLTTLTTAGGEVSSYLNDSTNCAELATEAFGATKMTADSPVKNTDYTRGTVTYNIYLTGSNSFTTSTSEWSALNYDNIPAVTADSVKDYEGLKTSAGTDFRATLDGNTISLTANKTYTLDTASATIANATALNTKLTKYADYAKNYAIYEAIVSKHVSSYNNVGAYYAKTVAAALSKAQDALAELNTTLRSVSTTTKRCTGEISCSNCGGDGKVTGSATCSKCNGTGGGSSKTCSRCDGTGEVGGDRHLTCSKCGGTGEISQACSTCSGTGSVSTTVNCTTCSGTGKIACTDSVEYYAVGTYSAANTEMETRALDVEKTIKKYSDIVNLITGGGIDYVIAYPQYDYRKTTKYICTTPACSKYHDTVDCEVQNSTTNTTSYLSSYTSTTTGVKLKDPASPTYTNTSGVGYSIFGMLLNTANGKGTKCTADSYLGKWIAGGFDLSQKISDLETKRPNAQINVIAKYTKTIDGSGFQAQNVPQYMLAMRWSSPTPFVTSGNLRLSVVDYDPTSAADNLTGFTPTWASGYYKYLFLGDNAIGTAGMKNTTVAYYYIDDEGKTTPYYKRKLVVTQQSSSKLSTYAEVAALGLARSLSLKTNEFTANTMKTTATANGGSAFDNMLTATDTFTLWSSLWKADSTNPTKSYGLASNWASAWGISALNTALAAPTAANGATSATLTANAVDYLRIAKNTVTESGASCIYRTILASSAGLNSVQNLWIRTGTGVTDVTTANAVKRTRYTASRKGYWSSSTVMYKLEANFSAYKSPSRTPYPELTQGTNLADDTFASGWYTRDKNTTCYSVYPAVKVGYYLPTSSTIQYGFIAGSTARKFYSNVYYELGLTNADSVQPTVMANAIASDSKAKTLASKFTLNSKTPAVTYSGTGITVAYTADVGILIQSFNLINKDANASYQSGWGNATTATAAHNELLTSIGAQSYTNTAGGATVTALGLPFIAGCDMEIYKSASSVKGTAKSDPTSADINKGIDWKLTQDTGSANIAMQSGQTDTVDITLKVEAGQLVSVDIPVDITTTNGTIPKGAITGGSTSQVLEALKSSEYASLYHALIQTGITGTADDILMKTFASNEGVKVAADANGKTATQLLKNSGSNWYNEYCYCLAMRVSSTKFKIGALTFTDKIPLDAGPAQATSKSAYFSNGYALTAEALLLKIGAEGTGASITGADELDDKIWTVVRSDLGTTDLIISDAPATAMN